MAHINLKENDDLQVDSSLRGCPKNTRLFACVSLCVYWKFNELSSFAGHTHLHMSCVCVFV